MTLEQQRSAAVQFIVCVLLFVLLCVGCGDGDEQAENALRPASKTVAVRDHDQHADAYFDSEPVGSDESEAFQYSLPDLNAKATAPLAESNAPLLDGIAGEPSADKDEGFAVTSQMGQDFGEISSETSASERMSGEEGRGDGPGTNIPRTHNRAWRFGNGGEPGSGGGGRPQVARERSRPLARHQQPQQQPQPPATFELQPGEELWVIAASDAPADQPANSAPNPNVPGCGALLARLPEEPALVPVPQKHTAVTGTIDGYIASVDVQQQFRNPFDAKIEAVYVFPLPANAAVNEFVMTVGERRIRGIIRERQEATKIYNEAKSQGHVASLLTQERPNMFTQKVANIEPGKQIDIDLRYFHPLRWDDGAWEFVFPMVVGPRFNPVGSADPVAAVARGNPEPHNRKQVQYLSPNERSGHDIALTVDVRAGVDIEHIDSVNHLIKTEQLTAGHRRITLANGDSIPNRDFVLRCHVAGEKVKSALMTHRDEHGRYFTMMLYPPTELSSLQRSPMEMVFVLDCSGSMSGQPLDQSKAAVRQALSTLTPRDTFQIIRFSSRSSQLGRKPLPATAENVGRALSWLSSLNGSGGTQMIEGIRAALDFPHDEGRFRLVSFLTDGFIGNEQEILTTLHQKLGASRVFSFGVGQAPNRFLMDRMALVGRGAVTYLSLNDSATDVMNRFVERISHPALTDVSIDWGEMQVEDMYPSRLPDLIVGRPVVVTGRFTGELTSVRVGGRTGMQPIDYEVRVVDDHREHRGIAAVWARHRIADLMHQVIRAPRSAAEVKQSVLQTALNHNLMSAYTAFVAVDSLTRTSGDFGTTVAVPVPVPEGVTYETTVSK